MMLLKIAIRGTFISSRSCRINRQLPCAFSSVISFKHFSASRTLSSKTAKTSSRFFGCGGTNEACDTSKLSGCVMRAKSPGTFAICHASCPSVIDFALGFQASFCAGTRSCILFVVAASSRNSDSIGSVAFPIFLDSFPWIEARRRIAALKTWRATPAGCRGGVSPPHHLSASCLLLFRATALERLGQQRDRVHGLRIAVPVVMPHPCHRPGQRILIAPLRCHVEPVIGRKQNVEPARV